IRPTASAAHQMLLLRFHAASDHPPPTKVTISTSSPLFSGVSYFSDRTRRRFSPIATFSGVSLNCSTKARRVVPSCSSRVSPFTGTLITTERVYEMSSRTAKRDVRIDDNRAEQCQHDPHPRLNSLIHQTLLKRP